MVSRRDLGVLGGSVLATSVLGRIVSSSAQSQASESANSKSTGGAVVNAPAMGSATIAPLNAIRDTLAYNLHAIETELSELQTKTAPSSLDFLKARAFILSYAGRNDEAVRALEALVSQKEGRTSRALGKLAQVLTRRDGPGDAAKAFRYSEEALKISSDDSERWLANQNMAIAALQLGQVSEAQKYASAALAASDDPRTRVILEIAAAARAGGKESAGSLPASQEPETSALLRNLVAREALDLQALQPDSGSNQPALGVDPRSLIYVAMHEMGA